MFSDDGANKFFKMNIIDLRKKNTVHLLPKQFRMK
jgi:hypothetical protein